MSDQRLSAVLTPVEPTPPSKRGWVRLAELAVILACLGVWFARRPTQLLHPYVWAEELRILDSYIHGGWAGALQPMSAAGYEILPVNVLVPLSARVSWDNLPIVAYIFATLIFLGTICMVVLPASRWGGLGVRAALALAIVLVPADPEGFGVLLYGFWWTALWPLIILGWRSELYRLRVPLLVLASLGSPAGGALTVVYLLSFARHRRKVDLVSGLALLPGFVWQVVLVRTVTGAQTSVRGRNLFDFAGSIGAQIVRPAGVYPTRWLYPGKVDPVVVAWVGGVVLALLLVVAIANMRRGNDTIFLLWWAALIYLLLTAIAFPVFLDPRAVGRYYFLPYVTLAWILICLIAQSRLVVERVVAVLVLIASLIALPPVFVHHVGGTPGRLSWSEQVRLCADADDANGQHLIPIYTSGALETVWQLPLFPRECRALAESSLFR